MEGRNIRNIYVATDLIPFIEDRSLPTPLNVHHNPKI
jgi:hypothetical protein